MQTETDPRKTTSRHDIAAPLSICLVSPISGQANGGTAAYIRLLGQHLTLAGHTVTGASRIATENARNLHYEYSDADQGVRDVDLGNWTTRLIAPRATAKPFLRALGKTLPRPPLRPLSVKAFEWGYADALKAAVQNAQVVHYTGNGWELMGFAACAVARKIGAAFTVLPFAHPGAWGDGPLDVELYNRADAVFVCSHAERNHLEKCGVRPEKFQQTGMAPASAEVGDGAAFRRRHNLGDRPLVLFLGRKQRYKGYHVLCEAMAAVLKTVPDACLVAAGPDVEPPFPAIPHGGVLDLGELKPNPVDAQHKADALAACDVFCMPSEAEAFGLVYVEAWANAKPVIGGPAPAVNELVEQGVNGYTTHQDAGQVADRIVELLQNPVARQRMGQAGYQLQQKRFTWDAVVRTHEAVFRDVLNRRNR